MTILRSAAAAALLALSAAPALADRPVEIRFAAEIGGVPFTCAQAFEGLGATATRAEVADFRLFVSNVRLIAADGREVPVALDQDGAWQHADVALIDFEDGSGTCINGTPGTNTVLRGTVPEGDYTGLAFDIGVPFALNHGDPTLAPAPLNLTAMFWNWQGGYKFVKLDMATAGQPIAAMQAAGDHAGQADAAPAPRGWSLHLGSTGCASEARTVPPAAECANPNRVAVRLEGFDPAANLVVIDPAPVLAAADLDSNAPETSPGCMSFPNDDDCLPVMSRLGLAFRDLPAGAQLIAAMR